MLYVTTIAPNNSLQETDPNSNALWHRLTDMVEREAEANLSALLSLLNPISKEPNSRRLIGSLQVHTLSRFTNPTVGFGNKVKVVKLYGVLSFGMIFLKY